MRREPSAHWQEGEIELFLLLPENVHEAYVGWLNDELVNRYLESRFALATLESTRQFVAAALANEASLFCGIRLRATNRHVGNIKLAPIDWHHGLGEIGIMIGERTVWGTGVATTAINIMCTIAKEELQLRKLTAGCYASNAGSVRAFVKAGFIVEGTRKQHFLCADRTEDLTLLARHL
jgi:RimJ/RimL family protein N-acetyltransferase